ncbi:MAG: diguanylate cyclase domain-containing protein [Cellvibrionaceae bacterium]
MGITKILHIGDLEEYDLLGSLLGQIHHCDYQLTGCQPSDDVLVEILSQQYSVILLDYHWGGGDVAKNLLMGARAKGCHVPIIVMTDEMEADVDREAISLGASDYLIKGRIDSQLIERTIRYAIERKNAESRLSQLAHFDPLTNIPNRILFRDRLEHALQLAKREELSFTLMYMDLNGFKQINDKFGHDAGDKLLQSSAKRLNECMRRSDSVARIGGDEFTLLLEKTEDTIGIARFAEKIVSVIEEPHIIEKREVFVGCSIGIAVYPEAGRDSDTLQRNADMAMYQAKQADRSEYRFFTEAMNVKARRQLLLETDLQSAIEHNEFDIFYQPRVNLINSDVVALKSIVRWYHPSQGWLNVQQFLDTAENIGLVMELAYWTFQKVSDDFRTFNKKHLSAIPVSIALSHRHLLDGKLLEQIKKYSVLFEKNRRLIELTFDESILSANKQQVSHFFESLKELGFRTALTNLGEGLMSVTLLSQLKIDRIELSSTLTDGYQKEDNHRVISLLTMLASRLNSQVSVAELSSDSQCSAMIKLGCTQGYGDAVGEACGIEDLTQLVSEILPA